MASKTQRQQTIEDAREALEVLGGKTFQVDEQVRHEGTELILPVGVSLLEGADILINLNEEQKRTFEHARKFKFRPWDVAYNGHLALKKYSGAVTHKGGFMSPPALIDVAVGPDEVVQVPWGNFQVVTAPKTTFTFGQMQDPELGRVGTISASGPKSDQWVIQGIFNAIELQLKETSIYKGKAIDGQEMPNFIAVEELDERLIVYAEQVQRQLEANLLGPLANTEAYRRLGLPLKRAVLLYGPFGTGKTLALKLAGKIAVANGWTFLLVRPGRDSIEDAMRTARLYGPALVALEDVDTYASVHQEADRISQMLDLFDGMDAKGQEIMVALTTNHIDAIHKGMLRPGRLDSIIEIGAPDAEGIRKLVEANSKVALEPEIDWQLVGAAMQGYLPAFVVATIELAVAYRVRRVAAELATEGVTDADTVVARTEAAPLTTDDLVDAALEFRTQWKLQQEAKTGHEEPELDRAVKNLVQLAIEGKLDSRLLVEEG